MSRTGEQDAHELAARGNMIQNLQLELRNEKVNHAMTMKDFVALQKDLGAAHTQIDMLEAQAQQTDERIKHLERLIDDCRETANMHRSLRIQQGGLLTGLVDQLRNLATDMVTHPMEDELLVYGQRLRGILLPVVDEL